MKLEDLREHVDNRFDRIEDKLDPLSERVSATETHISWLRGHLNVSTAIIGTIVSGFVLWWMTNG